MKIYIAGSSQELGRCERAILFATSLGFKVTYDWTESVRTSIAQGVLEHELPFEHREHQARRDLQAIDDADAIVVLLPEKGGTSRGCWIEFGYALGVYAHKTRGTPLRTYLLRDPLAANVSLFEALGTTVYCTDDRHGLGQVAHFMRPSEGA